MARTPSNMLALGTQAPNFLLPNTIDSKAYSYDNISGAKGTVVMFICNHCPYVIHVLEGIVAMAKDYQYSGIGFVAISSNDVVNYPSDDPVFMKKTAEKYIFTFPYLYDETQDVAKKYKAECTPEFYLFNQNRKLVYRGRMDETSPGSNTAPSAKDLRVAIKSLLMNQPISDEQFPSMGCNIKWKVS